MKNLIYIFSLISSTLFTQTQQKTTYTYDELGNRISAQTIDSYQDLPNIEISIDATGASCVGNDNGEIFLLAENTDYDYTFTINTYIDGERGPQISSGILENDTNWQSLTDNLVSGEYIITTNIIGISESIYTKNYILAISEPSPLLVSAKELNSNINLEMVGGTPPFYIAINDIDVITTDERTIELAVNSNDIVSVHTEKPCEGSFNQKITGDTTTSIYPNPVKDKATIILNNTVDDGLFVLVKIYDEAGNYISKQNPRAQNNTIVVGMENINTGVYYIHVPAINQSFKVIKE